MLISFGLFLSFCVFSFFMTFSFPFVLGFLGFSVLFLFFSGYSSLVGLSFVSLFGYLSVFNCLLIIMTFWVTLLMILVSMKYQSSVYGNYFVSVVLSLLFVVTFFFFTDNFLFFYVMFEVSLLPTVLLILKWGYQPERLQASFYFVMYTICASLPLLVVVMKVEVDLNTFFMMFDYPFYSFGLFYECYLFYFVLVFAFLVKVPMWGVHLWLPKAHVEAPVSGSMILAGVLLKLGGYGLMKVFMLGFYVQVNFINFLLSVNLWGAVVVSIICLCSFDVKVLIAYSSIIHMGVMVVGVLSGSVIGWLGSMLMMISHGFSSPGMFSMANFNYESVGTRNLVFYKGLGLLYPVISFMWFLLLAANMGAPPSLNLVSEIFICMSILKLGFYLFFFMGLVTFLSAGYNLYLYSCQQGDVSFFVLPSGCLHSSFILSCFMHVVPVYISLFAVFLFCF